MNNHKSWPRYSRVKIAVSLRATARERGNLMWIPKANGFIIHESSLLQMRGTRHDAVVFHCECLVTKQMQ